MCRAIVLNAVLIGSILGIAALSPAAGHPVLVAVAPWAAEGDVERVIARAGGQILDGTSADFAAYAASNDAAFVQQLYRNGARAVIGIGGLAGCLSSTKET